MSSEVRARALSVRMGQVEEANPFASTEAELDPATADLEPTQARERALPFERRVLRIASWLMFFGVWFVLFGTGRTVHGVRTWSDGEAAWATVSGGLALLVGWAQIWVGFRLRRFAPASRLLALVLVLPLVVAIPIGTWVGLRSFVELLRPGARDVLSEDGAALRAATSKQTPKRPSPVVPLTGPFVILATFWAIYQLIV